MLPETFKAPFNLAAKFKFKMSRSSHILDANRFSRSSDGDVDRRVVVVVFLNHALNC